MKVSSEGSHVTQMKLLFLRFVLEVLIMSSFDTYINLNTSFITFEQFFEQQNTSAIHITVDCTEPHILCLIQYCNYLTDAYEQL